MGLALRSIQRLIQSSLQFVCFETEWTWLRLICHTTFRIDQIQAIRPSRISLLGRVSEFVDDSRNLDAKFSHAGSGHHGALFFISWTSEHDLVFYVALHLPNIAWMGFGDVDHQKINFVAVLIAQLVEGGNLPPEGWSCIASEDETNRFTLSSQRRKLHCVTLVEFAQGKIGRSVAHRQFARTCLCPKRFEGERKKGHWPRQLFHKPRECLGRLLHDAV